MADLITPENKHEDQVSQTILSKVYQKMQPK
jgi:hypothetical protein